MLVDTLCSSEYIHGLPLLMAMVVTSGQVDLTVMQATLECMCSSDFQRTTAWSRYVKLPKLATFVRLLPFLAASILKPLLSKCTCLAII